MKLISPHIFRLFATALVIVLSLSSCTDERETMVEESVRLISKATMQIQDVGNIELRQLKDIPAMLQDSLSVLQNKHPNVVLSDEDADQIRIAMNKFTQAQENAIAVFTRRIDDLEESVVKITAKESESDSNSNES